MTRSVAILILASWSMAVVILFGYSWIALALIVAEGSVLSIQLKKGSGW